MDDKECLCRKIRGDRPEWESNYKPKYVTCHYCKGSKRNKVSYREYALKDYEVEIGREPISKRGCFISTAVMNSLGSTDDCIELTQLRKFRDNYVKTKNEVLIDLYYEIAPSIVQKIDNSKKPQQQYQQLWEHYIKVCYNLILLEKKEEALITYEMMLHELCRKYKIRLDRK